MRVTSTAPNSVSLPCLFSLRSTEYPLMYKAILLAAIQIYKSPTDQINSLENQISLAVLI
jgi:hypothetical protein